MKQGIAGDSINVSQYKSIYMLDYNNLKITCKNQRDSILVWVKNSKLYSYNKSTISS